MYNFYKIRKIIKTLRKFSLPLVRDEDSTSMGDMLSGADLRMTSTEDNGVNS